MGEGLNGWPSTVAWWPYFFITPLGVLSIKWLSVITSLQKFQQF